MEATNQLKLYSITEAARALALGKDAVYDLVAKGKIGYIEIGKRKKIPYQELVRFQNESVMRLPVDKEDRIISKVEIDKFLNTNRSRKSSFNANEFLQSIMR